MSSWLYNKLRLGTKRAAAIAETPPPPPPCTPNRASYYVPSRDRALPRRLASSPRRLRDTRFPQPGDIVLDVVARPDRDRVKPLTIKTTPPPEQVRLRPILTRPTGAGATSNNDSAASRARPRFHAMAPPPPRRRKKAALREADEEGNNKKPPPPTPRPRLRWAYERQRCVVVVKESADPEEDFLASMMEMVAASYDAEAVLLRSSSPRGLLEDLLACYLALNDAQHHRAIVAAFRRAWTTMHLHYCMRAAANPS